LAAHLSDFAVVELDIVRVVGRDRPATIHALLGDEAFCASPAFLAFRGEHRAMLADYRSRRWDEAQRRMNAQGEAAAMFGLGKLYEIYGGRVRECIESPPPADWNAIVNATTK
jgi:adenylate cyclase